MTRVAITRSNHHGSRGPLVCAIYARKSNDEHGVASEAKSITRQIDHARAYARKKGWTVDDAHIYSDDAVSGAEFLKRPGFQRLMQTLQPRPPFDVLIMSESSRLGREAWETGFALKQILKAGVRVFFYLEDRECSFDHPIDKLQFSIVQAFDEMERTRASQRATDKWLQLMRAGKVPGRRLYGFNNQRGTDGFVERVINAVPCRRSSRSCTNNNSDATRCWRRLPPLRVAPTLICVSLSDRSERSWTTGRRYSRATCRPRGNSCVTRSTRQSKSRLRKEGFRFEGRADLGRLFTGTAFTTLSVPTGTRGR